MSQGVAEAESRRAADAAEHAYREAFDRSVSPDEGQLNAEHARALAAGQAVFNEAAVGALSHLSCHGHRSDVQDVIRIQAFVAGQRLRGLPFCVILLVTACLYTISGLRSCHVHCVGSLSSCWSVFDHTFLTYVACICAQHIPAARERKFLPDHYPNKLSMLSGSVIMPQGRRACGQPMPSASWSSASEILKSSRRSAWPAGSWSARSSSTPLRPTSHRLLRITSPFFFSVSRWSVAVPCHAVMLAN